MFMNNSHDLKAEFMSMVVKKPALPSTERKVLLTRDEDFVDGRKDIFDLIVETNRNGL